MSLGTGRTYFSFPLPVPPKKMTPDEWKEIRHFSPTENWGDASKVSYDLVKRLDALRKFCGNRIVIHCGYETKGHSENSQHYLGKAADFHIIGISLINQYLLAERFNFGGIGVYPNWNNPGLHCDVRDKIREEPYNRWAKVDGKYIFLNETVLRKCATQSYRHPRGNAVGNGGGEVEGMKTIRRTTKDGDLQEIQYKKDATITLDWMNGKNYPPSVSIKKGDELISWNFLKDPCGGFYAEGLGRPWPAHERKRFDKCLDLGKDRKKAVAMYYRLIAQTKRPI